MEVWWVAPNGSVQDAYWYEGAQWQRFELAAAGSASTSSGITSLSRVPGSMEVWWVSPNGSVQDAFFYPSATTGDLGSWHSQYTFDNGVPVGGYSTLKMYPDGSYQFSGHFRDSGFPSYDVALVCAVKAVNSGTTFTFTQSGHLHGTIEPGSRDYDWNVSGHNGVIKNEWQNLQKQWVYRCEAKVGISIAALVNIVKQVIGAISTIIAVV